MEGRIVPFKMFAKQKLKNNRFKTLIVDSRINYLSGNNTFMFITHSVISCEFIAYTKICDPSFVSSAKTCQIMDGFIIIFAQ